MTDQTLIPGFDYSHYNDTHDFAAAYASGIRFAIGKCTQGLTYVDPYFHTRAAAARAAGLVAGAYHFFDPTKKTEDQADHFLTQLDLRQPWILALDTEWTKSDSHPQEDWDLMSAELRGEIVQNFMDRVIDVARKKMLNYTDKAFANKYLTAVPFGLYGGLWLARYAPDMPAGFANYKIWQQTEGGTVAGVNGKVDLDVFQGTQEDLEAMAAPAA